jgi:MFS family permease
VIAFATTASIDAIESGILVAISLVTFALFLYLEPRRNEPLLDMQLFRIRLFSAGNISQLLYSLGFGCLTLIMILYFQLIRGYDAFTAGLLFLPLDLAFVSVGPISGKLSDRYGTRWLATIGMGVRTVCSLLLAFLLTPITPLVQIEIILTVTGLGMGLYSSPNISSIMASVPPERRGVASAVRATLFNSGNVISIGLVAYIVTTAIPYSVVSGIISGGYTSLSIGESIGFVTGVGRAFIVTGIITFFGMIASSLRGPETRTRIRQ